MSEFQVVIDTDTLMRSRSGAITGLLSVKLGTLSFPDGDWSDFPIVVLGWWLEALHSLQIGRSVDLRFMDGPFFVRLTQQGDASCKVECYEDQKTLRLIADGTVALRQILEGVVRASGAVAGYSARMGWNGDDLDQLEILLRDARSAKPVTRVPFS